MENTYKLPPEIKERFQQLPTPVQNIILKSGWEKTIRTIVDKYKLRIDQGSYIETETMLIMFGFVDSNDFLADIIKDAGVEPEIAQKIEAEVGEKIFKLIKDSIRNITEVHTEEAELSKTDLVEPDFVSTNPNRSHVGGEGLQKSGHIDSIIESRLTEEVVEKPKKIDPYLEPID